MAKENWNGVSPKINPDDAEVVKKVLQSEYPSLKFNVVPTNDEWTEAVVQLYNVNKNGLRVSNTTWQNVIISATAAAKALKMAKE